MASYHLTAKIGTKGKAAPHAAYITREGKYSESKRHEDLEATGYGNMPAWAEQNPAQFWIAADEYERANGSAYREIEIALPRELNTAQRLELVNDFIRQEIGNKHAYQYAIHTPKAAIDADEQPHAHIMYSERIRDGIERDPEQYFKRYNTKQPEKGGAKKHSGGKKADELKAELLNTRERWANIQNRHLKKHGHSDRVTHLSLKEQGIDRTPEKHIGINAYKLKPADKADLVERRADAKEHRAATDELSGVNFAVAIRTAKWIKEQKEKERQEREEVAALMREIKENAKRRAEEYSLKREQDRQTEREKVERERIEQRELRERMQQAEKERRRTPAEWEKMANDELVKVFVEVRSEWRKGENQRLLDEAEIIRTQSWALKAEEPSRLGGLWFTKKREQWETDLQQKLDNYHALKQQAQDAIDGKSPKEREQIRHIEDKARALFKEQQPRLAQALLDKAAREQAERDEQRRVQKEQERQKQEMKPTQQKSRDSDLEL